MGQANRRGTYEERKEQAVIRNAILKKAADDRADEAYRQRREQERLTPTPRRSAFGLIAATAMVMGAGMFPSAIRRV